MQNDSALRVYKHSWGNSHTINNHNALLLTRCNLLVLKHSQNSIYLQKTGKGKRQKGKENNKKQKVQGKETH